MSGYLLDTSAWLCTYHEPERLSTKARQLVQGSEWLGLASISLWEVATKVSTGKLPLPIPLDEWFRAALPRKIRLLDLSPQVAVEVHRLSGSMHADPADRIIAATAIVHNLTILVGAQIN